MSEVEARPQPTRGRGSGRGGRGGFGRGGQRGTRKPVNGSTQDSIAAPSDEPGEIGDMKRKYHAELPLLKDMFADWTDVDLLFALQECDGDLPATVDRITQGSVSQFSEVKSAKDRARSRVKEESTTTHSTASDKTGTVRSVRGRGDGARGGRGGRATERGRGGQRGGRGGHATTNGAAKETGAVSVPTTESSAWNTDSATDAGSWENNKADSTQPAAKAGAPPSDAPAKKTWASMFSAPPKPAPAPKPSTHAQSTAQDATNAQNLTPANTTQAPTTPSAILNEATQPAILAAGIIDSGSTIEEAQIPPPKDPLTAENVEHLPDASHPPATHTAASTVGSNDPRNLTPLPGQSNPIELAGRPPLGGFQTSAYRAASGALRSSSYQRRVQEQHEAVVMPGHNAVDRAAVQFGSMGLNGEPGPDVDEEREDPETRQAHQHSPPSQPKASLPPVPRPTAAPAEHGLPEAVSTKQAPGLPPASQQNQPSQQDSALGQNLQQDQSQHGYGQNQYSGYGQSGMQQNDHAAHQKPYDPFAYQTQQQYDRYGAQNQSQQQAPQQHSGFGGLTSSSHDYSAYYTSAQQRDAYNQYYGSSGSYGADNRQHNQQQDTHGGQRAASGYGNVSADSAYGAQSQQQTQPRYGESTNSGHNTPNPLSGPQHNAPNAQQSSHQQPQQQQQQQHHQQNAYGGAASGFPYGHPYFNSPYQQAYQNQFGYQYGASYPNKAGGMYGSPQGYNMGSQSSFDQHGSASSTAPYNQQQQPNARSASGVSSGVTGSGADEYGRASAQSGSQQAGSSYGAINDPFARTPSGFNQAGYGGQTTSAGQDDALKAYDNKTGASPAHGQPGRPGSAANNPASTSQSGLPPAQNQQSGYGAYQGYPGQTSQYGGLGGLGGHQQQGQNTQGSYGSYNAGGFGQYGGGYNSRGGWGQSYGAH